MTRVVCAMVVSLALVAPASAALLHDNGPLVNSPGTGAGGADESTLQTALGLNTYGFGYQVSAGNRLADDFTVPGGQSWTIDHIEFFGYQSGSGLTSSFTSMNLQIWDGAPGVVGSSVVFGDTTTNRMTSTVFSNIYRVLDTASGNEFRPVMLNTVAVGTTLGAGTYWLDFQADGNAGFTGPWAPPITINGVMTTGNAIQYVSAWNPALDGTSQQGLPFKIYSPSGPTAVPEPATLVLLGLSGVAVLLRRRCAR